MTVSESSAVPKSNPSNNSNQPRDKTTHASTQAPNSRGRSQRADNLAEMLSLDRLISRGIHEDRRLRIKQASATATRQKMLARAITVLETTRLNW